MKPHPVDTFIDGRSQFPVEELRKHLGNWVAFSQDGRRIVASAPDLDRLADRLAQLGVPPEGVVFEGIPDGSMIVSGSELY